MGGVNPFILTNPQLTKLSNLGLEIQTDSVEDAKQLLIGKLKSEIYDISEVYDVNQLLELHEAVFGEAEVIRVSEREVTLEVALQEHSTNKPTRKKIRIELTRDISYAFPLLEHLAKFDNLAISEIKTGLAVKFEHGGYRSNIINFNELRTIHGVLHGNLYFNMVKTEEQFLSMEINMEYQWFRSFIMIPKVSIYDVVQILTPANIRFLVSMNQVANKRKIQNKDLLLETAVA